MTEMPQHYERITSWAQDHLPIANPELSTLAMLWLGKRDALIHEGRLEPFVRRLKREWAIETGLIERLYTWDRGITETLIEQGIDAAIITSRVGYDRRRAENVRNLILDQESVIDGLFEFVKGDRPLSEHYIRSLHQALTAHQETTEAFNELQGTLVDVPLLRGQYKKLPNNPTRLDGSVHNYCPVDLVDDEMQALVAGYAALPEGVAPEVSAAWLHHRFTHIHPFQDGNGRVARALATLVFLKEELLPLVMREADRNAYIDALEQADAGELASLVSLFARRQRDVILAALSTDRVAAKSPTRSIIKGLALAKLEERQKEYEAKQQIVFATANILHGQAYEAFQKEALDLDGAFKELNNGRSRAVPYSAQAKRSAAETQGYYRTQIIETARALGGYFANLEIVHHWARLSMQTGPIFEFVVSIHGVGREFNGVLVATAFTNKKHRQEEGGAFVFTGVAPACTEAFQFNYLEKPGAAEARFATWLDKVTMMGLAAWHLTLDG